MDIVTSAKKPVLWALILGLTATSGCGWFGGGNDPAPQSTGTSTANPLLPKDAEDDVQGIFSPSPEVDASVRIGEITSVTVDRSPSWAVLVARGLATRQGAYNAVLRTPAGQPTIKDGVLELEFVVLYPDYQTAVGTDKTRDVYAARSLTTQTLQELRTIRVLGATNSREATRR